MHGNLRYVKSPWIALTMARGGRLPCPARARDEPSDRGVLAVAADGTAVRGVRRRDWRPGCFQASGLNLSDDYLYRGDRAVYVEPANGTPFGFFPGLPVGVSG